jgi:hypothetical protein
MGKRYIITCTTKRGGTRHKHIVGVGGTEPDAFRLTTAEVLTKIRFGDVFVSRGAESRKSARVRGWPDEFNGPGLRSFSDGGQGQQLAQAAGLPLAEVPA